MRRAEQDYALVIGIAHYPGLRSLEGPVLDAQRIKRWLLERAGLPEENVEPVMSREQIEERPVLEEVDKALGRILKKAKSGARRLYVYFAGHGCSEAIGHIALLMANADLDNFGRSMNATEYRDAMAQRLFPEQVYLFDCCRNYDRRVLGRRPELTVDPKVPPVPGLVQIVLYAAGFHEFARESHIIWEEKRQGLFTEALLEGMEGAAAVLDEVTGEGLVTTDRLIPYVRDRLDDLTGKEAFPIRQHMWWEPRGLAHPLTLATRIAPWRKQVIVTFPPNTTQVFAQDDRLQIRAKREVADGESSVTFDLELAAYTFTAQPVGISSEPVRLLPEKPLAAYAFTAQPVGISSEPVRLLPDKPMQVNLG
jgi:hypothetical protein